MTKVKCPPKKKDKPPKPGTGPVAFGGGVPPQQPPPDPTQPDP